MKNKLIILFLFTFCSFPTIAQNDATKEETKAWIKEKVNNAGWANGKNIIKLKNSEYVERNKTQIFFVGDLMIIKYGGPVYRKQRGSDFVLLHEKDEETTNLIQDLSMGIEKKFEDGIPIISFNANKKDAIKYHEKHFNKKEYTSIISLWIIDEEKADRLIKAFKHLIKLYGGQEEKF